MGSQDQGGAVEGPGGAGGGGVSLGFGVQGLGCLGWGAGGWGWVVGVGRVWGRWVQVGFEVLLSIT